MQKSWLEQVSANSISKYYGKDKAMQLVTTSALAGFIFMVALSNDFLSLFLKNIHGYNQHGKPKNFRIYVILIPR
jgi:hypothetical protein